MKKLTLGLKIKKEKSMKVLVISRTQPNTYSLKQSKNVSNASFGIKGGGVLDDMKRFIKYAADKGGDGGYDKSKYEPVMSDLTRAERDALTKKEIEDFINGTGDFAGPGEDPFKVPGWNPDASD